MANPIPAAALPFSRLFSQFLRTWNYRPTTTWDHVFNPQFFINSNPDDAAVENDVLSQAGSYGKQLGTIIDALGVALAKISRSDLSAGEQRAVDRFLDLADKVNTVVEQHRPARDRALTTADADDFLDRLDRLRLDNPTAAQAVTEQLRKVVDSARP
jgi:hypothetical protein